MEEIGRRRLNGFLISFFVLIAVREAFKLPAQGTLFTLPTFFSCSTGGWISKRGPRLVLAPNFDIQIRAYSAHVLDPHHPPIPGRSPKQMPQVNLYEQWWTSLSRTGNAASGPRDSVSRTREGFSQFENSGDRQGLTGILTEKDPVG